MGKLLIIPLLLVGLFVGSLVWSGGGGTKRADLTYIDRGDVITLDPNLMSYLQDFRVSYAFREGLVAYSPGTLEPRPAGAERVEVSADKRVWTFHLRAAALWSDGTPVTSKDYVFAWRRMLEEPGDYTYLYYYIHNAEAYATAFAGNKPMKWDEVGIKAPDERTLVVTLDNPVTYFLDIVAFVPFYPLNERSMEPYREVDQAGRVHYRPEFTRPPGVVTNGPFLLKTWDFKRRLYLEKSQNYWDKENVKLNSIEVMINEDRLNQVLSFESGAVDWVADVSNDIAAEIKAKGGKDLHLTPGFGTTYLAVNIAPTIPGSAGVKNPLSDVRVRQAFAMAIDRGQIVKNITRMGEREATTYIPPGIFKGYENKPGFGLDVAKARELMAEAGYANGKGFPSVPLMYRVEVPMQRDLMQNIANQLQENLGVKADLVGLEGKICRARFQEKNFVIGLSNWIGDYGDPSTFTDKYLSNSLNNDSNWASKEYDDWCARASREPDAGKRMEMLEEAETILNRELPVIPLYHLVNMDWCKSRVKIQFNPRMTTVWKGIEINHAVEGK
ncbi:MAG TPA: peptide ABC transporter substrate-binding protein [Tepidisphaeraceae bacterium]|jgi:oligopeptide transport system substrate-binding protein|nr:peptide ABC transporter substrate-binding protein [Tepidisphaeraceae bacterium]